MDEGHFWQSLPISSEVSASIKKNTSNLVHSNAPRIGSWILSRRPRIGDADSSNDVKEHDTADDVHSPKLSRIKPDSVYLETLKKLKRKPKLVESPTRKAKRERKEKRERKANWNNTNSVSNENSKGFVISTSLAEILSAGRQGRGRRVLMPPRPADWVRPIKETDSEKEERMVMANTLGLPATDAEVQDALVMIKIKAPVGQPLPRRLTQPRETNGELFRGKSRWWNLDGSCEWRVGVVRAVDPDTGHYLFEWDVCFMFFQIRIFFVRNFVPNDFSFKYFSKIHCRKGVIKEILPQNFLPIGSCHLDDMTELTRLKLLKDRRKEAITVALQYKFMMDAMLEQKQLRKSNQASTPPIPVGLLQNLMARSNIRSSSKIPFGEIQVLRFIVREIEQDYVDAMDRSTIETLFRYAGGPAPFRRPINYAQIGPYPPPGVQQKLVRKIVIKYARKGLGFCKSKEKIYSKTKNKALGKTKRTSKTNVSKNTLRVMDDGSGSSRAGKFLSQHVQRLKRVRRIWAHIGEIRDLQIIDTKFTSQFSGGTGPMKSARTLLSFMNHQKQQLLTTMSIICGKPARNAENEIHDLFLDALDAQPPWIKTEPSMVPYRKLLQMANQMRWDTMRDLGCSAITNILEMLEQPSNFPWIELKDSLLYSKVGVPLLKNRRKAFEMCDSDKQVQKSISTRWDKSHLSEKLMNALHAQIQREFSIGYQEVDKIAPMFQIKLIQNKGYAAYRPSMLNFEEQMLQVMRNIVIKLRAISRTRPLTVSIFEELGKRMSPNVPPIEDNPPESFLRDAEKRVVSAIRCNFSLLAAMAARVNEYSYLLKIDTSNYLKSFRMAAIASDDEVKAWRDEIRKQYSIASEIDTIIPSNFCLGLFNIDCTDIRKLMFKHSKGLAIELLELLIKLLLVQCQKCSNNFCALVEFLETEPSSFRDLELLLKEIKNIEPKLQAAGRSSLEMWRMMDIFSEFSFSLSDDSRSAIIRAVAWPSKIMKALEKCEKNMPSYRWRFIKQLGTETKSFQSMLSDCEQKMQALAVLGVKDKIYAQKHAKTANSLMGVLDELNEMIVVLNDNRRILSLDSMKNDRIKRMTRLSSALRVVWCTAAEWSISRKLWMESDITSLGTTESTCIQYKYELDNAVIVVREGIPGVTNGEDAVQMINGIKLEIKEFWQFMPIVRAMQTPGVKISHKENVAAELGLEIDFNVGAFLTLKNMIDAGVVEVAEEIIDICTLAGVEFAIDDALIVQQDVWTIGHRIAGETKSSADDFNSSDTNVNKETEDEKESEVEGEMIQNLVLRLEKYPIANKENMIGFKVVGDTTDIFEAIHEQIIECEKIKILPFAKSFEARIYKWQSELKNFDETLQRILETQEIWLRIAPLCLQMCDFLEEYRERFSKADAAWASVLSVISSERNFSILMRKLTLRPKIEFAFDSLTNLSEDVCNTVCERRILQQRLYLLNDYDTISFMSIKMTTKQQILNNDSDSDNDDCEVNDEEMPEVGSTFTEFLPKMFDNIFDVVVDPQTQVGCIVIGVDGERLILCDDKIAGTNPPQVELPDEWVGRLDKKVQKTLQFLLEEAWDSSQSEQNCGFFISSNSSDSKVLDSADKKSDVSSLDAKNTGDIISSVSLDNMVDWAIRWPTQIALAVISLNWTCLIERTLLNHSEQAALRAKIDDMGRKASMSGGYGGKSRLQIKKEMKEGEHELLMLDEARQPWETVVLSTIAASNAFVQRLQHCRVNLSSKRKISQLEILTLQALRNRDIVSMLPKYILESSFEWQAQMRFYLKAQNGLPLQCRLLSSSVQYNFEYLSPQKHRLIVTPLTDRCRRVLMVAIQQQYGGLLIGPHSSGKVSMIRGLALELGTGLIEYTGSHCSETALPRLIRAAAGIGLWLIAKQSDELKFSQMTDFTKTAKIVREASVNGQFEVTASQDKPPIRLHYNRKSAFFMTACSPIRISTRSSFLTYAKQAFRVVGVMEPDTIAIVETILQANDFVESREIAKCIVTCLRTLSQIGYYTCDTGHCTTAAIACAKAAANAKHSIDFEFVTDEIKRLKTQKILDDIVCDENDVSRPQTEHSTPDENEILSRKEPQSHAEKFLSQRNFAASAISVLIMPYLTENHQNFVFQDIVNSIFGAGTITASPSWHDIIGLDIEMNELLEIAGNKGFQLSLHSAQKVCEVISVLQSTKPVIICGSICSGKTSALNLAAALWSKVGNNINNTAHVPKILRVFPQAHSTKELLGWIDSSQRWSAGIIPSIIGTFVEPVKKHCIIQQELRRNLHLPRKGYTMYEENAMYRDTLEIKEDIETVAVSPISSKKKPKKKRGVNQTHAGLLWASQTRDSNLNSDTEQDSSSNSGYKDMSASIEDSIQASKSSVEVDDEKTTFSEEEVRANDYTWELSESKKYKDTSQWIVFDGPASRQWIEQMYPLFSASNEFRRLKMEDGTEVVAESSSRFVFECISLSNMSPSAISCCSVVAIGDKQLQSHMLVRDFILRLPNQLSACIDTIYVLTNFLLNTGIQWARTERIENGTSDKILVIEFLRVFETLLKKFGEIPLKSITETTSEHLKMIARHITGNATKDKTTPVDGKDSEGDFGVESSLNYPSISTLLKTKIPPILKLDPIHGPHQLTSLGITALIWSVGCKSRTYDQEMRFKDVLLNEMSLVVRAQRPDKSLDKLIGDPNTDSGFPISTKSDKRNKNSKAEEKKAEPLWSIMRDLLKMFPGARKKGISMLEIEKERETSMLDWKYDTTKNIWSVYRNTSVAVNTVINALPMMLAMPRAREARMGELLSSTLSMQTPIAVAGRSSLKATFVKRMAVQQPSMNHYKFHKVEVDSNNIECIRLIRRSIQAKLTKRKTGVWSPPKNENLIVFIEDAWHSNDPQLLGYGEHSGIRIHQLLRQLIECGGWFEQDGDTSRHNWCQIRRISLVASIDNEQCRDSRDSASSDSFDNSTQRLRRHFNVVNIPEVEDNKLSSIFCDTFVPIYSDTRKLIPAAARMSNSIAGATIDLLLWLRLHFIPSSRQPQYVSFRNLKQWSTLISTLLEGRNRSMTVREVMRFWWYSCAQWIETRISNTEDRRYSRAAMSEIFLSHFDIAYPAPNSTLMVGWESIVEEDKTTLKPQWQWYNSKIDKFVLYKDKKLQRTLEKTYALKKKRKREVNAKYKHRLYHFDLRREPMQQILTSTGAMVHIRRYIPKKKKTIRTQAQVKKYAALVVIFKGIHKSYHHAIRKTLLGWRASCYVDSVTDQKKCYSYDSNRKSYYKYPEYLGVLFTDIDIPSITSNETKPSLFLSLEHDIGGKTIESLNTLINHLHEKHIPFLKQPLSYNGRLLHSNSAHILRIVHALRYLGGSKDVSGINSRLGCGGRLLIWGDRCSGKKTCTRLAASLLKIPIFESNISLTFCNNRKWSKLLFDVITTILESRAPVLLFVTNIDEAGSTRLSELHQFANAGEIPRMMYGTSGAGEMPDSSDKWEGFAQTDLLRNALETMRDYFGKSNNSYDGEKTFEICRLFKFLHKNLRIVATISKPSLCFLHKNIRTPNENITKNTSFQISNELNISCQRELSWFYKNWPSDHYASWSLQTIQELIKWNFSTQSIHNRLVCRDKSIDLIAFWPQMQDICSKIWTNNPNDIYKWCKPLLYETVKTYSNMQRIIYTSIKSVYNTYYRSVKQADEMKETLATIRDNLDQVKPRITVLESNMVERKNQQSDIDEMIQELTAKHKRMEGAVAEIEVKVKKLSAKYNKRTNAVNRSVDNSIKTLKKLKRDNIEELGDDDIGTEKTKLAIAAICVMLGVNPNAGFDDGGTDDPSLEDYWIQGRKLMSDSNGLIAALLQYDKTNISSDVMEKMETELFLKNPLFTCKEMAMESVAAEVFTKWIRAICALEISSRTLGPLKEDIHTFNRRLEKGKTKLAQYQEQLSDHRTHLNNVVLQVQKIRENIQNLHKTAKRQEKEVILYDQILKKANTQIIEWKKRLVIEKQRLDEANGNIIIAAFATTHLGMATQIIRDSVIYAWNDFLLSKGIQSSIISKVKSEDSKWMRHPEVSTTDNSRVFLMQSSSAEYLNPKQASDIYAGIHLITDDESLVWQTCNIHVGRYAMESAFMCAQIRRDGKWPLIVDVDGSTEKFLGQLHHHKLNGLLKDDSEEVINALDIENPEGTNKSITKKSFDRVSRNSSVPETCKPLVCVAHNDKNIENILMTTISEHTPIIIDVVADGTSMGCALAKLSETIYASFKKAQALILSKENFDFEKHGDISKWLLDQREQIHVMTRVEEFDIWTTDNVCNIQFIPIRFSTNQRHLDLKLCGNQLLHCALNDLAPSVLSKRLNIMKQRIILFDALEEARKREAELFLSIEGVNFGPFIRSIPNSRNDILKAENALQEHEDTNMSPSNQAEDLDILVRRGIEMWILLRQIDSKLDAFDGCFSWDWMTRHFRRSIASTDEDSSLKVRCKVAALLFTRNVHRGVRSVISAKSIPTVDLFFALSLLHCSSKLPSDERDVLLALTEKLSFLQNHEADKYPNAENTNLSKIDHPDVLHISSPIHWLSDEEWQCLNVVSQRISLFESIIDSFIRFPQKWHNFVVETSEPMTCRLPKNITPLQRIIIIACTRRSRLGVCAKYMVTKSLLQNENDEWIPRLLSNKSIINASNFRQAFALVVHNRDVGSSALAIMGVKAMSLKARRPLTRLDLSQCPNASEKFNAFTNKNGYVRSVFEKALGDGEWLILENAQCCRHWGGDNRGVDALEVMLGELYRAKAGNSMFRLWIMVNYDAVGSSTNTSFFSTRALSLLTVVSSNTVLSIDKSIIDAYDQSGQPAVESIHAENMPKLKVYGKKTKGEIPPDPIPELWRSMIINLCATHAVTSYHATMSPNRWNSVFTTDDLKCVLQQISLFGRKGQNASKRASIPWNFFFCFLCDIYCGQMVGLHAQKQWAASLGYMLCSKVPRSESYVHRLASAHGGKVFTDRYDDEFRWAVERMTAHWGPISLTTHMNNACLKSLKSMWDESVLFLRSWQRSSPVSETKNNRLRNILNVKGLTIGIINANIKASEDKKSELRGYELDKLENKLKETEIGVDSRDKNDTEEYSEAMASFKRVSMMHVLATPVEKKAALLIQARYRGIKSRQSFRQPIVHQLCNSSDISIATAQDDAIKIQQLASSGVDVSAADLNGITALHIACWDGNLKALVILHRHNASFSKRDTHGNTPIHFLFAKGHTHCIQYLEDAGVDIAAMKTQRNMYRMTPEMFARAVNNRESQDVKTKKNQKGKREEEDFADEYTDCELGNLVVTEMKVQDEETKMRLEEKRIMDGERELSSPWLFALLSSLLSELPTTSDLIVPPISIVSESVAMDALLINNVLRRESKSCIIHLRTIHVSIRRLMQVLIGGDVIDSSLCDVVKALQVGKVPASWAIHNETSITSAGSTNLQKWVQYIKSRVLFLQAWTYTEAKFRKSSSNFNFRKFHMPSFFNPRRFVTTLQCCFTKYTPTKDASTLRLSVDVRKSEDEEISEISIPKNSVCLFGLSLKGALWDKKRGAIVHGIGQEAEYVTEMPEIWISFKHGNTDDASTTDLTLPVSHIVGHESFQDMKQFHNDYLDYAPNADTKHAEKTHSTENTDEDTVYTFSCPLSIVRLVPDNTFAKEYVQPSTLYEPTSNVPVMFLPLRSFIHPKQLQAWNTCLIIEAATYEKVSEYYKTFTK